MVIALYQAINIAKTLTFLTNQTLSPEILT